MRNLILHIQFPAVGGRGKLKLHNCWSFLFPCYSKVRGNLNLKNDNLKVILLLPSIMGGGMDRRSRSICQ